MSEQMLAPEDQMMQWIRHGKNTDFASSLADTELRHKDRRAPRIVREWKRTLHEF